MKVLVTGGCGFIGKHFVKLLLDEGHQVVNVDRLSYAADIDFKNTFHDNRNYIGIYEDIVNLNTIHLADWIVHFAAESHVDNSITDSKKFLTTNILGTQRLLELVRLKPAYDRPKFLHVSTDEVYGDIESGSFRETALFNPSNPYAASKAAAEHLVTSWARTYGVEYLIVRPSNNYGPRQYYEKLIPRSIYRLARGQPVILHGDGSFIRTWTHVRDTCNAIYFLLQHGKVGEAYNISSGFELSNLQVIEKICKYMNVPKNIQFVSNRSGQDVRYSINTAKLNTLGYSCQETFDVALQEILLSNTEWKSYEYK